MPTAPTETAQNFRTRAEENMGSRPEGNEQKQLIFRYEKQLVFAKALNEIAETIISNDNSEDILERANCIIGETLQLDRALIYDVSFEKNCITGLCEWLKLKHPDIAPTKNVYPLDMFISPFTEIKKTQKHLESQFNGVNEHFIKDGSGKILHEQLNIKSLIWYPFAFNEHGYYVFTLNQILEQRQWTREETGFLESVAKLVNLALIKIQFLEERQHAADELKKANDVLEQRMEKRTAELRKSKKFSIEVLDSLPSHIAVLDASGEILKVNETWKRFAQENGASADIANYVGENYLNVCSNSSKTDDESANAAMIGINAVLQGEKYYFSMEYPCHSPVEKRWFLMTVSKLHGSQGVVVSHTNITERKLAEEKLKKSEELYHTLVETSQDLIWQCDTEGKFTFLNLAVEQVFGYELVEILGNTFSDFQNPDNAALGKTRFNQLMDGGMLQSYESSFIGKSGNEIHLVVKSMFLCDEQGEIVGASGTAYDITELKQIEEALLQAKADADSANRRKSEFLSNMSHELRNPMNGVLGMTQLLEMTDLNEEQRNYVTALNLSGKNLLSLINDILDLSKIEAGKITIEPVEFSLHQCINDVVLMQKSVIFGKGLKLTLDVAEDIPQFMLGDQLRVKQILHNLMGNAIKFTSQGGITISVQLLELQDSSLLLQLAVRDTGIGISPENLDKIFMPFEQETGSTTRNYGGTGLGLTISRHLTELMGGSISVESTPGEGSCFKVSLPFTTVKESFAPQDAPQKVTVNGDGPSLRILLVENDQVSITFSESLLRKLGHKVIIAENGRECIAVLENGGFDIVLMDIQMPIMNGDEALREIRSKEQGTPHHLPVIALTAYSLRNDKERFIQEGFDGYVSKPMAVGDLIDEMKRVLGI